ncbi:MAG: hypothetical protein KJZ86_11395 [Caldilineaceae bacterium]|nr:hypothetical protein [Caldilineaceae bacterium]
MEWLLQNKLNGNLWWWDSTGTRFLGYDSAEAVTAFGYFRENVLVKNIVKSVGGVCNRTSSGESAVANRTYVLPSR